MTLPTLADFTSGAATSAAAVQSNDSLLANTFGAIDVATNISNTNAPMLIGPIRVPILSITASTLFRWTAPVDVELWELHVSPVSAVDGTTAGSTLDSDDYASIQIVIEGGGDPLGPLEPKSLTTSYTLDLSGISNRTASSGSDIHIQVIGGDGTPKYHANISILAYTKHRE